MVANSIAAPKLSYAAGVRCGPWSSGHRSTLPWATPRRHGWTRSSSTPIACGSACSIPLSGSVPVCVLTCGLPTCMIRSHSLLPPPSLPPSLPLSQFQHPHRLVSATNVKAPEDVPPGVLSGNFYRYARVVSTTPSSSFPSSFLPFLSSSSSSSTIREITGGDSTPTQGYINELYCIHEPNIPLDTVTFQCKSLALQLWQNTKQALAPFPLIN